MPTKTSPWIRQGSRKIYENPWIKVREDQVVRPDGRPGIYGVVEWKARTVAVVALSDEADTFLVGQHRYAIDKYSWEVPEGGVDPAETPLDGARRELREETGITAASWTYLGETFPSNSITTEWVGIFLAERLTIGTWEPDATERLKPWRLPLLSAFEMAMTGQITDALAIVALARARAHLESGRRLTVNAQPLALAS